MLSICFFSFQAIKNKYIDIFKVFLFILILSLAFYSIYDYDNFFNRAVDPNEIDIVVGVTLVIMILLALYISSGAIMSTVVFIFILYAYFGAYFNDPGGTEVMILKNHRTSINDAGGHLWTSNRCLIHFNYSFTIFGAFLSVSGAGNFFVKLAQSLSKIIKILKVFLLFCLHFLWELSLVAVLLQLSLWDQ